MRSRTENAVKNIIFGVGGQGIEAILKFIGRTVFIQCLSVAYLGVNGLFSEILTMLSLAELGVGTAIGYALYKPIASKDEEKIAALMRLYKKAYMIIGVVVSVIGLALIPFLHLIIKDAGGIDKEIIPIYVFYLFNTVITYFFSYKTSLLISDQKNYVVQMVKEICNILRTIFQCIILVCFHNFYLYLLIESLFIVANNIWISVYVDKKYPFLKTKKSLKKLDSQVIKSLWINIRALMLQKISTILVNSTDNVIISMFGGIIEVGLYSNYLMFITLFTTFLGQLFGNISASVGNLNAEGNLEKSNGVFHAIHMANFWLYSWVSIGIAVMINPIITIWIGSEYLLPDYIVYIIAINFYIKGMMNAVWVFKDTFGLFRYGQYMTFVTAILNLVLSVLLGKYYGLFGILAATAISRLITNVWYDPYALFKHGFKKSIYPYYVEYVLYTILAIGVFYITHILCDFVNGENMIAVLLKLMIACMIPNVVYFIILRRTDSFIFLYGKVQVIFNSMLKERRIRKHD